MRFLILLGLAAFPFWANADDFDPSKCPSDADGNITVRLVSGIAFQFEPGSVKIYGRQTSRPSSELPIPGCSGNPIVAEAIAFEGAGFPNLFDERSESPSDEWRLLIMPALVGWSQAAFLKQMVERTGNNNCKVIGESLKVCRYKEDIAQKLHQQEAYYTQVGKSNSRNGNLLMGFCEKWTRFSKIDGRNCHFFYEISDGLAIDYVIDDSVVPDESFIEFDGKVRAFVTRARRPHLDEAARSKM